MLTSQKSMNTIREAMKKGVLDYILKDMANPPNSKVD
jgi:response regulator of citrate/malate metabolism